MLTCQLLTANFTIFLCQTSLNRGLHLACLQAQRLSLVLDLPQAITCDADRSGLGV